MLESQRRMPLEAEEAGENAAMILMYFTERPYRYVPEDEVIKHGGFFGLPNKFFDPEKGAQLFDEYLNEAVLAEEAGFDAIMLNEHHGTPFCLGAVMNVEASILARITRKVRIVLLGNPLPTFKNPLRVAEELAMIDCISYGRLVPGWVRGAGSEQIFNNANPAYNRELFNEAHDLILAAWVRPYQKPRPPIWIPGVLSPETVEWCAEHKYPYLGLGTSLKETVELWNLYGDTAAKHGYLAGSENFGYVQHVFVTDNEQKAEELGRCHLFGGGQVNFSRPEHTLPPGYNSKAATRRLAQATAARSGTAFLGVSAEKLGSAEGAPQRRLSTKQRLQRGEATIEEARAAIYSRYPKTVKSMAVISGTPKTVLPKIRRILETLRPSVFGFFATQGPVSFEDRLRNIRLLGQEVLPAVREYGKELGLLDPFEREPGSRPYIPGTRREPVVSVPPSRATAVVS